MQNMVLHGALLPPIKKKGFFLQRCHCQRILSECILFTQRQQEVWDYCLVWESDSKFFGGETKPVIFYLGGRCWGDVASIFTSPLLLHIGNKRETESLCHLTVIEQLLGGRTECFPYKGKAAVLLTKIRRFSALMLLGFNIYPGLLAETCAERHSSDETEALNLSNSQFQVQSLGKNWSGTRSLGQKGLVTCSEQARTTAAVVPNFYCYHRKSHAPAFSAKGGGRQHSAPNRRTASKESQ